VCQLAAPASDMASVAAYELTCAEAAIGRIAVQRRRAKVVEPVVKRITTDLKYIMRRESERVLDLLQRNARLPYTVKAKEAAYNYEAQELARLLLNGVDVNQYQAVLEDLYRSVGPGAMDQAALSALDAAGIRYRKSAMGDVLLSGGFRLVRAPMAERWLRDNAIVWGRRYAEGVSAKTSHAVSSQLAQGMSEFESIPQLAKRVTEVYADAAGSRALTIARTESNRAYAASQLETGRQLQADGKGWIISGSSYSLVDVCSDNAAMGVIPLGAVWAHGEVNGPAHPNCECSEYLDYSDDWQIPDSFLEAA
jgi:hypothetical protein